jgi:hypothetical protein
MLYGIICKNICFNKSAPYRTVYGTVGYPPKVLGPGYKNTVPFLHLHDRKGLKVGQNFTKVQIMRRSELEKLCLPQNETGSGANPAPKLNTGIQLFK